METVLEIIFEFILEGSLGASTDKKAPPAIRLLALFILILVYGGGTGLCVYYGIVEKSWPLIALAVILLVLSIALARKLYRKYKKG